MRQVILNEKKSSLKFIVQRFTVMRATVGLQNECTSFENPCTANRTLHATNWLFNGEISYTLMLLELMHDKLIMCSLPRISFHNPMTCDMQPHQSTFIHVFSS
ncbi:hypothetical protein EGW08_019568 [Elysia chlorotica]|uniref:Uncharacterized protein n=1 Tax=Elysia chlorotica TaxID=188477 RepID=A0A3S0ZDR8_ELYCH|nr:hypothetical protein EGW08_019568 [Elysia chlorotica]